MRRYARQVRACAAEHAVLPLALQLDVTVAQDRKNRAFHARAGRVHRGQGGALAPADGRVRVAFDLR